MLQTGRDFRVRAQAAFALGHKHDVTYAAALERALTDKHLVVRAAAASALGGIAAPRSLPALRVAMRDRESAVADAARAAVEAIEVASKSAKPDAANGFAQTTPDDHALGNARYALVIGTMHNESGFAGSDLARVLMASLQRELGALHRVVMFSAEDKAQLANAEARGLPMLRLEGNVVQIMRERAGEQMSVHCEIALLLMDQGERNLRTVLKGAATGIEATMGPVAAQEKRLARKAVDGAVRSALRNASSALENAAARADVKSGVTATASLPDAR